MKRYDNTIVEKNDGGKRYLSFNKYPKIPNKISDIYIYPSIGDRLDKLALSYYNDESYWWIISIANNIPKDTLNVPPGTQIRIPQDIQNVLYQYKVINRR